MPWGRAGVMKVRRQQTSLHNKEGLLWKAKEEELVMGHQAPQQKVKVKVKMKSLSHVRLFATPWTVACQDPPSWDFPGNNTEVGCHFLLLEIFPTQGLKPGLQESLIKYLMQSV